MTPAELALAALLALFPHFPTRPCVVQRTHAITTALVEGERAHGVPPALLAAVAFHETHLGCDAGEGGNWGAPTDRRHRHTAGTPLDAARALARSYAVCGDWAGAVGRFRSGLCRPFNPAHRAYVRSVLRLRARLER